MLHTIHHPQREPPERRTGDDAAGDREQEGRGNGADGEAVRRDGSDGQAVDQECARVIQQALAFEDRQDAMRRSQLAEHGGRGDGVGWSDDGAERNRRCPWHRRDERACDDGDGDGCESDREDHQPRDRRPIVLEVSQRRVVRRVEQYGCDEERQRKFGRKRERRRGWKKREQRTAERQEHRIRCSDAACCRRQDHGGDEETKELFELMHRERVSSPDFRRHQDENLRHRSILCASATGHLLQVFGIASALHADL